MISIKKELFALYIFSTTYSTPMERANNILNSMASTARCHEINTLKVLPSFAKEYGVAAVLGFKFMVTAWTATQYKHADKSSLLLRVMAIIQFAYLVLLFNPFNSPSWLLAAVYLADHITRCIHICRHYNSVPYASAYAVSNIAYYFFRDVEDAIICKLWVVLFFASHTSGIAVSFRMLGKGKSVIAANLPPAEERIHLNNSITTAYEKIRTELQNVSTTINAQSDTKKKIFMVSYINRSIQTMRKTYDSEFNPLLETTEKMQYILQEVTRDQAYLESLLQKGFEVIIKELLSEELQRLKVRQKKLSDECGEIQKELDNTNAGT